jgi:hypothetical protein
MDLSNGPIYLGKQTKDSWIVLDLGSLKRNLKQNVKQSESLGQFSKKNLSLRFRNLQTRIADPVKKMNRQTLQI